MLLARPRIRHRDGHFVSAVGDADHGQHADRDQNVNPVLLLAAKSFGARPHDVLWKVALPASVPMVVAGLRLGVGRALTGVVIAELFVAERRPRIEHRLQWRIAEDDGYVRVADGDCRPRAWFARRD